MLTLKFRRGYMGSISVLWLVRNFWWLVVDGHDIGHEPNVDLKLASSGWLEGRLKA